MGGSQSWLSCDATYPETDGTPYSGDLESGDPIIAVFMFLGTLVGLLLLTFVVHCGIIACRACRNRHRKRRHHRKQQKQQPQVGVEAAGIESGHSIPSVLVTVEHRAGPDSTSADGRSSGVEKSDEIEDESSESDSSLATSSDTSIDSTTARIVAQVAQRRRSRLLERQGASPMPGLGGGAGAGGLSMSSVSPVAVRGGVDNPAFSNRLESSIRVKDAV